MSGIVIFFYQHSKNIEIDVNQECPGTSKLRKLRIANLRIVSAWPVGNIGIR